MTVYIASKGEQGEGSTIIGVFKNKARAVKVALETKTCFSDKWEPEGKDYWVSDCDFIEVASFKIIE